MEGLAEVEAQNKAAAKQKTQPKVLAVASGKGGVGKTMVGFGFAWYLAKVGYRVTAIDVDYGVGNLHLSAGIGRVERSLDDFFRGRVDDLSGIAVSLEDNPKLSIVPAGGRTNSSMSVGTDRKQALIDRLQDIDADLVMLDIGAGAGDDNIDYFLAADYQLAVATADLSAMTALLAFLKKAQIHHVLRQMATASSSLATLEQSDYSNISEIFMAVSRIHGDELGRAMVQEALRIFEPAVVLNRVSDGDLLQVQRVSKNLMRHLQAGATVMGTVPEDEAITRCRRRGQNLLLTEPQSPAAKALAAVASKWHETMMTEPLL